MNTSTTNQSRFDITALPLPVIQAPMAGGPSTPQLAAAVSSAGGLGFLAAGYKTADSMGAEIKAVRDLTDAPFGVNLFVPQPPIIRPDVLEQYAHSLASDASRLQVTLGDPRHDDDDWQNKLDVLYELAPAVVSFTFDVPEAGIITALQERGVSVTVTVTSRAEAKLAMAAGADMLCVQGPEAGGHRGTFDPTAPAGVTPLHVLLNDLSSLEIPLIAAGGIVTGADTRAALSRGAVAVQAGTAFLRADEAGTGAVHRAALSSGQFTTTAVTKAFSGRYARGLYNDFMRQHDPEAPFGYPEIHHLTRPLRAAAAGAGDSHRVNLWAGTGFNRSMVGSARSILARLAT
ncbi:oxidoreductase [Arthrobacter sp. NicSoilB8]|nr:nitronate monooxygenase [Arthrobacter sp. NicSoilB8]BCW71630.1 oxidoreductase [Arthrobacter sp. NicSoilB8]